MGIQIVLTTTVFWIAIGNLVISEEAAYEALKSFDGISIDPKAILITYAVIIFKVVLAGGDDGGSTSSSGSTCSPSHLTNTGTNSYE